MGLRYRYLESRVHGIASSYRLLHRRLLTISFLKMYEFAAGHCLFKPEAKGDISCDVVHLAQMTQRTGQDHSDVALKQYEIREKQDGLKGKETDPKTSDFTHPPHLQNC